MPFAKTMGLIPSVIYSKLRKQFALCRCLLDKLPGSDA